jgi:hypothetical protein
LKIDVNRLPIVAIFEQLIEDTDIGELKSKGLEFNCPIDLILNFLKRFSPTQHKFYAIKKQPFVFLVMADVACITKSVGSGRKIHCSCYY